jgi:hypothetical protein
MSALWQGFVSLPERFGQMLFDISATRASESCNRTRRIPIGIGCQSKQPPHFLKPRESRIIGQIELIVPASQAG